MLALFRSWSQRTTKKVREAVEKSLHFGLILNEIFLLFSFPTEYDLFNPSLVCSFPYFPVLTLQVSLPAYNTNQDHKITILSHFITHIGLELILYLYLEPSATQEL